MVEKTTVTTIGLVIAVFLLLMLLLLIPMALFRGDDKETYEARFRHRHYY